MTQEMGGPAALVEQVEDLAIIALDTTGVVRSWNRGATRLTQFVADQAMGRHVEMFYPEEERLEGLPTMLLLEARDRGRVTHTGWRVRRDGSLFWGDVVITALHGAAGEVAGYAELTRDLTSRHTLEERLRASEERLRVLIDQVVDYAIIGLDPQGIIESWNLGAARLKGYSAAQTVGRSHTTFYTEEDRRAGLPSRLLETARTSGRVEHTGWRVRRDGTRFWGDVVITALHDPHGRLTGFVKVTRDRTDVKVLEDAQDAFYRAFEHDFQMPITALKGYVEELESAGPEDHALIVGTLARGIDRLSAMVDSLLAFASQRVAQTDLSLDDIDLGQVVRGAVSDIPARLGPRRVHITESLVLVHANGVAVHRVVSNLVSNALRYSPRDTPVTVGIDDPVDGRVRLSVTDQGRGIDSTDLASVFEPFARGSVAQDDGGTGLGLASVRALVEQMSGRVWIESELGRGTTVSVELPAADLTAGPDAG